MKYERPKMKRDARQKCSLFPEIFAGRSCEISVVYISSVVAEYPNCRQYVLLKISYPKYILLEVWIIFTTSQYTFQVGMHLKK